MKNSSKQEMEFVPGLKDFAKIFKSEKGNFSATCINLETELKNAIPLMKDTSYEDYRHLISNRYSSVFKITGTSIEGRPVEGLLRIDTGHGGYKPKSWSNAENEELKVDENVVSILLKINKAYPLFGDNPTKEKIVETLTWGLSANEVATLDFSKIEGVETKKIRSSFFKERTPDNEAQKPKNTLDAGKATNHKLEINGVAISEETLEELGIEYDDASGYMDHLEECSNQGKEHPDYINTQALLEEAGTDIIVLIKRNNRGAQKLIMPNSKEFNEVCEKLVSEEGIRVEKPSEIKSMLEKETEGLDMGKVGKHP